MLWYESVLSDEVGGRALIIKQLNLDHFGKFHGREIDLNPGVNIIYGANESGKSTVHAFIQSMLFGAERLRGRGAGRDAYSKYQPWEGGASYEGRMRISIKMTVILRWSMRRADGRKHAHQMIFHH